MTRVSDGCLVAMLRCETCRHFGSKPYDADPEPGWGVCELAWEGGGDLVDPSGDNLFVRPDFGCVLWDGMP